MKHRAAVTEPEGAGQLMRALDGLEGSIVTRTALKIMALCFPRPGELRHAEWTDIDLDKAIWTIPAERTKMRRQHVIPLAPQAVAELRALHQATGDCLPGRTQRQSPHVREHPERGPASARLYR